MVFLLQLLRETMCLNLRDRIFSKVLILFNGKILCFPTWYGVGSTGELSVSSQGQRSTTSYQCMVLGGFLAYIPPPTAANDFCLLSVKDLRQMSFLVFLHWQTASASDNKGIS